MLGGVESLSGFSDIHEGNLKAFGFVCKVRFVHIVRFVEGPCSSRIDDFGGW